MLVSDLIEALSEMDQDAPVRGVFQPQHPIEADITSAVELDGKAYIGVSGNADYTNQEVIDRGVFNNG